MKSFVTFGRRDAERLRENDVAERGAQGHAERERGLQLPGAAPPGSRRAIHLRFVGGVVHAETDDAALTAPSASTAARP